MGSSLEDLVRFPEKARHDCGYQLELVQRGEEPSSWRPMPDVGMGTREIRVRLSDTIYRVFYVATFGDGYVYVLHSFNKKTQATATKDMDLGKTRYSEAKKLSEQRKRQMKEGK